jgi:hypothetical protein
MLNEYQQEILDSMTRVLMLIGIYDEFRIEVAAKEFYRIHKEQCCTCDKWDASPPSDSPR